MHWVICIITSFMTAAYLRPRSSIPLMLVHLFGTPSLSATSCITSGGKSIENCLRGVVVAMTGELGSSLSAVVGPPLSQLVPSVKACVSSMDAAVAVSLYNSVISPSSAEMDCLRKGS